MRISEGKRLEREEKRERERSEKGNGTEIADEEGVREKVEGKVNGKEEKHEVG